MNNLSNPFLQLESVFKSFDDLSEDEKLKNLSMLQLRYFTPREIANLHGFPPKFGMCLVFIKYNYKYYLEMCTPQKLSEDAYYIYSSIS